MDMDQVQYTYVDTQEGVDRLCAHMASQEELAVDSEADNLHHYATRLCLLQLRFDEQTYLVDVLANLDLSTFWDLLKDKHLIMHGSDFDIRLFKDFADVQLTDIFDSMLASQLVGEKRFGLASLLESKFEVKLPKDSQKSDWSQRPLTPKMLTYAANDVQYLFPLRDLLMEQIRELGREQWLEQRCASLIESASVGFPGSDENAWRIAKSDRLKPRAQAGLYALWHWREALAEQLDRPPFKILGNEYVLKLAVAIEEGDWAEVFAAMPPGIQRRKKQGLVDAIKRGEQLDPGTLPKRPPRAAKRIPMTQEELDRQDRIKDYRDKVAIELGIDPTLVATRTHLVQISRDPEQLAILQPWQQDLLRPSLTAVNEGE